MPLRTLVVEDDASTRHLLHEVLRGRGHEVEACADAETAWEIARQREFDLALLDIKLPGMDGVALCRKLRLLPYRSGLVVMFVTASETSEDLARALEAGADDYLVKPVTHGNLPVRLALAERHVHFLHDRKRTEERLLLEALRDPVTQLPNRTLFLERLESTARRASRENRKPGRVGRYLYAVLYFNLDDFGRVNTLLGYEGGDEVLRQVAPRLEECIRSGDTLARLGADEFVILLDDMKDVSDPTRVVRRVEQALDRPFVVGRTEIKLSTSVGVSLSLGGASDPRDLIEEARLALVRAKELGPGAHQIHDVVIHARAMARLQLESRLQDALDRGHMCLHYQPIVDGLTGRTAGVEALVRWEDPERGLIGPEEFVPVAEDTGIIIPLSHWILDEAVSQLSRWRAEASREHPFFMSVNVSGRHFGQPDIAERLASAITSGSIHPGSVHIEVTETAIMTDLDNASHALGRLRESAVKVYVDDFGTGYSSLSYLVRLPLDGLKIDRSFVRQATHRPESMEVVKTIARLADTLGLTAIAEGVETEGQLEGLRALGVPYVQGYLFGRPVPADQMGARLGEEWGLAPA